jgi:hypothetical protein
MNGQRALSDQHLNTRASQAVDPTHGRASSTRRLVASPRAVRPASLAASARPQRFEAGSVLCAEPAVGIEEKAWLPRHSFFGETKNPMQIKALVSLGRVTACSEREQALRWSEESNAIGRAARAAMPNPSIERDVQGLAPLAAPHVKR